MARYLAQIIILGTKMVGRALMKTIRQEVQAFEDAARIQETLKANEPTNRSVLAKGMSLVEAQLILNVKDLNDRALIDTHYQHLFQANEKPSGGTFYIQSKVFRAKERIDKELARLDALAKLIDPLPPSPSGFASGTHPQSESQAKEPDHKSR
ncbi:mitochondrial import inner membrane translocase subunit Tim16 [Drosophila eugracilis]|uniref:mitochondrial import inner membrane translocase subunit Tim16 n=1 Tax=Drosophila eugracilis TaxID=29029 RepID=UPI0007E607FC|nr:mitochondrial import inner membrane translocase subunit Tim16 [Drosophila eugracilis]